MQLLQKEIKSSLIRPCCHANTQNTIRMQVRNALIVVLILCARNCVYSVRKQFESLDEVENNRINPKFINKWLDEYFSVSGNRVPPRMFIEWIKIASIHNCSIRPSDYRHIFEDLKPFKMPGMSSKFIQTASDVIEAYGREVLPLSQQKLTELSTKMPIHVGNSLDLLKSAELLNPELDFSLILQYSDESMVIPSDDHSLAPYADIASIFERSSVFQEEFADFQGEVSLLSVPHSFNAVPVMFPVFSVARIIGFKDIIMPTRRTGLGVLSGEQREAAEASVDWILKETKAVFRGTSTGIDFNAAKKKGFDITISPRFKLYELALLQRDGKLNCSVPLDFALTKYLQYNSSPVDFRDLRDKYPERPAMGLIEQFKSKYIVLVDGNGWTDKVAGVLLSGSLLFLSTIHEDWVTRQMIDGFHYIKINPDLSDLIEKLEWAHENDLIARQIAENGRQLAIKKLDTNHLKVYNALLIMEYQNLFI